MRLRGVRLAADAPPALVVTADDVAGAAAFVESELGEAPRTDARARLGEIRDPAGNAVELHETRAWRDGTVVARAVLPGQWRGRAPELVWARLAVDDFSAVLRFYRRFLQPTGTAPDEMYERYGWVTLWQCRAPDDLELELVSRAAALELLAPSTRDLAGITLVYHVDELDPAAADARANGFDFRLGERDHAPLPGRFAESRLSDGTPIELLQPPPATFGHPLLESA